MRSLAIALVLLLLAATPSSGQATSIVGSYLAPWAGLAGGEVGIISMSPDGETILFVETGAGHCSNPFPTFQRLSTIKPDGTGYRVVVDENTILGLWPNGPTFINRLALSGDGNHAAFSWPGSYSDCTPTASSETLLVDVASGQATPFSFNGQPVGFVSFSDDGTKMAFKGFDPATGSWGFYLANPDGTGATKFLDGIPWCSSLGVLSGDGTKYLFLGINNCICPCGTDVFLHDIVSGTTLQLNPVTLPSGTIDASVSFDGSRVVYGDGTGTIFGINGDGTGLHVISTNSGGGATTITRDGEHVFHRIFTTTWNGYRSKFDGSGEVFVGGFNVTGYALSPQPVNADGSLYAFYDESVGLEGPLGVWFENVPMLTTYGYGYPETSLTWDVGGRPGDSFILVFALSALTPPAGTQYGLLELDPASLFVLASGPILETNSVGTIQVTIPPSLNLPVPLPLHFQALVQPRSGGGKLTNRTTVFLQNAPAAFLSAPPGDRGPTWPAGMAASEPWSGGPPALTPEDQLRRLAVIDPQVGERYFSGR